MVSKMSLDEDVPLVSPILAVKIRTSLDRLDGRRRSDQIGSYVGLAHPDVAITRVEVQASRARDV